MSKENQSRNGCVDVFRAFLVQKAEYDPVYDIPCLAPQNHLPNRMIAFSKAISSTDTDQWVHFYEDDVNFERIWNNPRKYLPILKRFRGVISPDYSLYRDMPLPMQQWNVYRGRAIAHWLESNQIHVIPNVRYADEDTFDISCAGIPEGCTIAVGSHGCVKIKRDCNIFIEGLQYIIQKIHPRTIVVYGTGSEVLKVCREKRIDVIQFDSAFSTCHQKAVDK